MVIKFPTGHKVFPFNHRDYILDFLKALIAQVNKIVCVLVPSGALEVTQEAVTGFAVNFRFLSFISKSSILAVLIASGYPGINHMKIIAPGPF